MSVMIFDRRNKHPSPSFLITIYVTHNKNLLKYKYIYKYIKYINININSNVNPVIIFNRWDKLYLFNYTNYNTQKTIKYLKCNYKTCYNV